MRFVAGNAQHIGSRAQQQDSFGFSDPGDPKFVAHAGFLGVLADGMGGLTHGSDASRSAVKAFLTAYKRKSVGEPISKALMRCLNEANTSVLQVSENIPAGEEVGTTLVAAVLHDHALYWVSVGDSRIYLLRGKGLTRLTADHVYATELNRQVAEGKISLQDAHNHPERAALTSYLGQRELAHVDKNSRPLNVQNDDYVMLCSDGFYRALTENEIIAGYRSGPQRACDTLVRQALAKHRKQQDNLTVIALKRQTRRPISLGRKIVLVATAVLMAILSGTAGYLTRKYYVIPELTYKIPSPPPAPPSAFKKHPTIAPPPTNGDHATDTGKGAPKTQEEPKSTARTTQPTRGKPTQKPADETPKDSTQEKPAAPQNRAQGQQKPISPPQQPVTAPTAPTAPVTTPTPPKDEKPNTVTPTPKEEQPKEPGAPQKEDQEKPANPPSGNGYVQVRIHIEG